jgi:hypothetical protein
MDILRYVFFAMNWVNIADTDQRLEGLVRSGYDYNSWGNPEKLLS